MAGTTYSIDVTNDVDADQDRTVLLPVSLPTEQRPDRAVIFRDGSEATPVVVRMTPRRQGDQSTPASVTYGLFEKLGGTGTGKITCKYRRASFWDLIRFDARARGDAWLSVFGALAGGLVAWLTFDQALGSDSGVRWVASVVVFVIGLIVIVIKFRKELEDIGP
jgi:hypothetical protein